MYSTLLCLLPLLSLPLGVTASMSKETRELYDAAHRRAIIARSDSASDEQSASDSHGHGHFSNSVHNSHGHGHGGPSRRKLHHGSGLERKLVRRKKDVKQKQKKRGKTCRATSTLAATATSTEAEVAGETSIAAVENAARPTTATSASSSSSAWYEYPTDSATQTAGASSSSSSSSADDWESSAVATATASATTSSAAPAESTSASAGSSGSTSNLFPWGTGSAHWTTSDGGLSFEGALKPLTAGKLPSSGSAPDGSNALVASYPAGTVGLSSAGYSFYTEGAHNGVQVDGATEVSFSYSVYLNDGFQFVKGGKMPGLYGGTSLSQAKSCSGGRQDSRDSCFSARLMWRTNGAGEIYDYLPVPYTDTDTGYGESIQRGAYSWATGKWTTVAMRLKLNDIGQSNGEQELYVDGQSVISLKDVTFATAEGTKIYGIMAQTFFGGHTDDWASPVDQNIWFKDWSLAVLA